MAEFFITYKIKGRDAVFKAGPYRQFQDVKDNYFKIADHKETYDVKVKPVSK